jgi:glycerol-3-phosphate dehydrogenase
VAQLRSEYPFLTEAWAARLMRAYGTEARLVLADARTEQDLGADFGATLYEREVRWMMTQEFARSAADVVWRRSKLGLRMTAEQVAGLAAFMAAQAGQ